MNYLDKINDKKSRAKAKADADAILSKIESVKTAIKNAPESTLTSTLSSYVEELKKQADNYIKLIADNSKIAAVNDSKLQKMIGEINLSLQKRQDIIIPEIKIPKILVPSINIPKNDFSPITEALNSLKQEKGIDLDGYFAHDIKDDENVQYIGFVNQDGKWYIMESKKNTLRFVFGNSDYAKAFKKAASYNYELLNEAISGKI